MGIVVREREEAARRLRVEARRPEPSLRLEVPEGVHRKRPGVPPERPSTGDRACSTSRSAFTTWRPVNACTAWRTRSPQSTWPFTPAIGRLARGVRNAGVRLFDVDTGAELPALRHPPGITWTYSVAWHPDGRRLAAGCNDRKIHIWDTETGTEVMPPWVGQGAMAAWWPSTTPATGWELRTGAVWHTSGIRRPAGSLLRAPAFNWQLSPTDRLHGYSIEGTKVKLWRLAAGRELRVAPPP